MIYQLRPIPSQPTRFYSVPKAVSLGDVFGFGLAIGGLSLLDQALNPRPKGRSLRQLDKDYISYRDGWRCHTEIDA